MNIEIIGAMLSADSPRPIDGSAKGGQPVFTKEDAMQAVAGMSDDAWNYMQYIHIMSDDKIVPTAAKCSYIILKDYDQSLEDSPNLLYQICETALIEIRKKPISNAKRAKQFCVSEYIFNKKYRDIYYYALSIYNEWESDARWHIKKKLCG